MENVNLTAIQLSEADNTFDLTYREYIIWVIRILAVTELIVSIPFYAILAFRWRLTETIHWFMCNFIVSEILRIVATILRGAIESLMFPVLQRQIPDTDYSKVTNDMKTFLNTRAVLEGVLEIGHYLSLVFALITFYHYYKQLKNPCITERCHKSNFILSLVAWLIAMFYFAIITGLRIHSDKFPSVFFANNIITMIFYAEFVIASTILLGIVLYLYYLQFPKEDEYMQKNAQYFMMQTNKRIRILVLLILTLVAPATMIISIVSDKLKKGKSRPTTVTGEVLEDLAQIGLSLLAIFWPYIWIKLDNALNQEYEKFLSLFKKKKPKQRDGRVRVFRKR